MNYGAVIAAAGMSTRMNGFKQLMKLGDTTFVKRVVTNFHRAGIFDIVMITGYRSEEVERSLKGFGVTFLKNEEYATTDMFTSVKIGLSYLVNKCDRIFFTPVDVPFFTCDTVLKEMEYSEDIVIPTYHQKSGHPILLSKKAVQGILAYEKDGGLNKAYRSLSDVTYREVEVDDEGAMMDADTQQDYQELMDLYHRKLIHPAISVSLQSNKVFFEPRTLTLLKQIDRLGNVRAACSVTNISYSKGWELIKECEANLKEPVVLRQAGGNNGGKAALSESGKKLIACYEILCFKVQQHAEKEFEEIFLASNLFQER